MANPKKANRSLSSHRNDTGSMGVLICCGVLVAIVGIGAFAADISHHTAVRSELQSAADAAAIAGAKALVNPETASMAEEQAMSVAGANKADGKPVTNDDGGQVEVAISEANDPGELATCQVTARRTVSNWLATLIGRPTDVIAATSKAAASATVDTIDAGILFPLAVSIDAVPTKGRSSDTVASRVDGISPSDKLNVDRTGNTLLARGASVGFWTIAPAFSVASLVKSMFVSDALAAKKDDEPAGTSGGNGNGNGNGGGGGSGGSSSGGGSSSNDVSYPPLKDLKVGDTLRLVINSDKVDNAGWTSFTEKETNANWLHSVVDIALDLAPPNDNYKIPSCTIGQPIFLTNGVKGFKDFAQDPAKLSALKAQDVLYLPVVEGDKFNQSRPLIGWVAVKINAVYINNQKGTVQEFESTILKAPVRGKKGDIPPVPSGDAQSQSTLEAISPSAVRLVSTQQQQ